MIGTESDGALIVGLEDEIARLKDCLVEIYQAAVVANKRASEKRNRLAEVASLDIQQMVMDALRRRR